MFLAALAHFGFVMQRISGHEKEIFKYYWREVSNGVFVSVMLKYMSLFKFKMENEIFMNLCICLDISVFVYVSVFSKIAYCV